MVALAFIVGTLFGIVCGLVLAYHLGRWATAQREKRIRRIIHAMTPEERAELAQRAHEALKRGV
jgi:hypothetical protein